MACDGPGRGFVAKASPRHGRSAVRGFSRRRLRRFHLIPAQTWVDLGISTSAIFGDQLNLADASYVLRRLFEFSPKYRTPTDAIPRSRTTKETDDLPCSAIIPGDRAFQDEAPHARGGWARGG
jgi:hypothetical protein